MSQQNVVTFLQSASQNEAVQRDLAMAHAESVVSTASRHGASFTVEDYAAVMTALGKARAGELSESELLGVTGGVGGLLSGMIYTIDPTRMTYNPPTQAATPMPLPRPR